MERQTYNPKEVEITTSRLYLRTFGQDDITEEYVTALNDQEVIGLTEQRYRRSPATMESVKKYADDSNTEESILLGIFLAEGKRHIGNIRLHTISQHNKRAELGIMIFDKAQWGKGYATESLMAVSDWAFGTLGLHKIEAEYYSTNIGSSEIFRKAGYIIEGAIKDHFFIDGKFVDAIKVAKFNPSTNVN